TKHSAGFKGSNPTEAAWGLSPVQSAIGSIFRCECTPRLRRLEEYWLAYCDPPASSDGAVDPSLVVPHPNNRLEHFCSLACRVRVKVDHRAALVAMGDGCCGSGVGLPEREDASHPFVFFEWDCSQ